MDHFQVGRRPHLVSATVITVVVAQLLAVTGIVAGRWAGLPLWMAAAASILVGAAMFVRISGRIPVEWAYATICFASNRRVDIGGTEDFRSTGDTVGLHWIDGQALAVVEVLPGGSWTRITRSACDSREYLPLTALAGCLEQHDVALSGIDVLTHGTRSASDTPAARVYDELIGPLPAAAQRTVWLVLRFDPAANHASVARRGGGIDGASRTLSVAARRVVRTLADAGCRSRILSAAEVESVCIRICRGVHPDSMSQAWGGVPLDDVYDVGNAVDRRHLSRSLLTGLWSVPSLGTTVCLRLRPGRRPGTVRVGASFRRTTRTAPRRLRMRGLISAQGRHRDSLLAHLPVASPGLDAVAPLGEIAAARLDGLRLPVTGCGQLVGSDRDGNAVTAQLVGPAVTDARVAGTLHLAQQVVFRAVATGARVVVHTDRPHAWTALTASVAAPERLCLADETSLPHTGFDAVVVDGVPAPPVPAGATTVHVSSDPHTWSPLTPDVSIVQPEVTGDRVVLTIGDQSIELALVTIAAETAFVGRSSGVSPRPVGAS